MTDPLTWRRPALVALISFTLFVVLVLGATLSSAARGLPPLEIDLLEHDAVVGVTYSCPPEGSIPNYIHEKTILIGNEGRQSLFMHPPASAAFRLQIPQQSSLQFSMAIESGAWDKAGDGVDFQVRIRHWDSLSNREVEETLFSQYVNPKADPTMRRWVDGSADLGRLAGQSGQIIFQTLPHDSAEYDWAGWSRLRIVRK